MMEPGPGPPSADYFSLRDTERGTPPRAVSSPSSSVSLLMPEISIIRQKRKRKASIPPAISRDSKGHHDEDLTRDHDSICSECERIDFVSICNPRLGVKYRGGYDVADLSSNLPYRKRSSCILCRLFAAIHMPGIPGTYTQKYSLRAFSSLWIFPGTSHLEIPKNFESIVLAVVPKSEGVYDGLMSLGIEQHCWTNGYLSLVNPTTLSGGMNGHLVSKCVYLPLYKDWIQYCQKNHGPACNISELPTAEGIKLIDCENRCVVSFVGPAQELYVALSYVWGSAATPRREVHLRDTEGDFSTEPTLPSKLPAVVEDAIKVTKGLGLRYLWCDRYCIDQGDVAEKHGQIEQMGFIYAGAEVTIVAAAGQDGEYGLPGVDRRARTPQPFAKVRGGTLASTLRHPYHSIKQSTWSSRGWTYQEAVLSRRRLVFVDEQVYFECGVMNRYESFSAPLTVVHSENKSSFYSFLRPNIIDKSLGGWGPDPASFVEDNLGLPLFKSHVEHYSSKVLSYESDILNAFAGIVQSLKLNHITSTAYHFWGIPFDLTKYFDASGLEPKPNSSRSFVHALQWSFQDPPGTLVRRSGFPSWSWCGWKNPVTFSPSGTLSRYRPFGVASAPRGLSEYHPRVGVMSATSRLRCSLDDCNESTCLWLESQAPKLNIRAWIIQPHEMVDLESWNFDHAKHQLDAAEGLQEMGLYRWRAIIMNTGPEDPIIPMQRDEDFTFELLLIATDGVEDVAFRVGLMSASRQDLRRSGNFECILADVTLV